MFNFSIHPTHPFLQPYVSSYCLMEFSNPEALTYVYTAKTESVIMFPIGMPATPIAIEFNFPNTPDKQYTFYSHQTWLGGLLTEPNIGRMSPQGHYLCVILTPFGLHHLLRESATVITNRGLSIDNVAVPPTFKDLMDKLYHMNSKTKTLQLVENELLNYYGNLKIPFSVKDMSPVTNYIRRQKGIVKVKELEDKFRVSGRWLQKQFLAQVGLSPKEYARVTRFNAFLDHILMTPSVSLDTLLDDYAYYDKSHLNRDFKAFTGQTPLAFLTSKPNSFSNTFMKQLE
jgi:AraC-like DNA-binding protein